MKLLKSDETHLLPYNFVNVRKFTIENHILKQYYEKADISYFINYIIIFFHFV